MKLNAIYLNAEKLKKEKELETIEKKKKEKKIENEHKRE